MFPQIPQQMGGIPPQLLALMMSGAGGGQGAPQGGPPNPAQPQMPPMGQMPMPPIATPENPNSIGGALTEDVPMPPADENDLTDRKSKWASFWEKATKDPNFGKALTTFGARALMNKPGMGMSGNIAAAVQEAQNLYYGLEERDEAKALAAEEREYVKGVRERQLGVQEGQLDVQKEALAHQKATTDKKTELEGAQLDIQSALADADITLKNAQAEALKSGKGSPGATQMLTDAVADAILGLDNQKPEDQRKYGGDRKAAFMDAFKMMNQQNEMTPSQFRAQMLTRIPPELLAESDEDAQKSVERYMDFVDEVAKQLFSTEAPEGEAGADALVGKEIQIDGKNAKVLKDLGDGRVQIQIEGESKTRTGPKSALGL